MSDSSRIPAQDLPHVQQLMSNLSSDLKQVSEQIEYGQSVSVALLQHIETDMLRVLDFISPEIRSAVAKAQRYAKAKGGSN